MRYVESYIHHNQIGVLIELEIGGGLSVAMPEIKELASDIAMQIAASNPIGISVDDLANVLPLKFRSNEIPNDETPLLQQEYIKDTGMLVEERIQTVARKLKVPIRVLRFVRFAVDDT